MMGSSTVSAVDAGGRFLADMLALATDPDVAGQRIADFLRQLKAIHENELVQHRQALDVENRAHQDKLNKQLEDFEAKRRDLFFDQNAKLGSIDARERAVVAREQEVERRATEVADRAALVEQAVGLLKDAAA